MTANPIKILLLDIETAPHRVYSWGLWGQDIGLNQIEEPGYTLCWAAKWLGGKDIFFSSVRHGRREMLQSIYDLLNEADAVVHYHGTKFDIPTLNQEFLKERMKPPSSYVQIDLLKTVRRKFRLPSNKLSYVAQHLGLRGKVAHKGMALWKGCMEGNEKDWEVMEQYNKRDITLLEEVYNAVLPWIVDHPNLALFDTGNIPVCPNCGGVHLHRRGNYYTRTMRYQRYQCQDCGTWSRERVNNVDKDHRPAILTGVN